MKTIEEFLAALAHTPRTWRLTEGYGNDDHGIRTGSGDTYTCPMSAVLGAHGVIRGEGYGISYGLSAEDSLKIRHAADEEKPFDQDLRAQLLKAVGLEEAK